MPKRKKGVTKATPFYVLKVKICCESATNLAYSLRPRSIIRPPRLVVSLLQKVEPTTSSKVKRRLQVRAVATIMSIAFYPTPVLTSIKRIVSVEGRSLMNRALCLSEDLTVSPLFRVAEPRSTLAVARGP